eukprot:CAMPEP_0202921244 /NCGR_PEP_ID=MMETSP1392-20130828/77289_1 /ASSEMBLY_ACC=CAM_ASM_000868 /TAXON_ID=225041 /ORGANISM="Chlamydomonas chlamydogama, Strain SAG 11-48b" /LENGTH=55 /DNA_ID=CAMNT_0049614799 /DNA_START=373 /DNA_END=540 /DNA_ORIENTATION=-
MPSSHVAHGLCTWDPGTKVLLVPCNRAIITCSIWPLHLGPRYKGTPRHMGTAGTM